MISSAKTLTKHVDCAVVGDWHLAFVTAACLADLGHKVLLVNPLSDPKSTWSEFPKCPVTEPGLPEMMANARDKGLLDFANGVTADWSAEFVWMAIDTPVNERDEADTTPLERVAQLVSQHGNAQGTFITSSQIPMGFSQSLEKRYGLTVAYIPENLRLGKGIETFLTADRTVIGAAHESTREKVRAFLNGLKTDFLLCDLVTAEMIKHATNSFLATSISFSNQLARIGERMGADNQIVGKALKMDKRIGKGAYVIPGLGFAGGTLPRDLRILQSFGKQMDIPTPLIDAVLDINESTGQAIVGSLRSSLSGDLQGKVILVLGYTYKAETDTLRRSPSLELAAHLRKHGARVVGYDPVMNGRDLSELTGKIDPLKSLDDLPAGLDAVVLMTPRPEFKTLEWRKLAARGKQVVLLDTHSFLPADEVVKAGISFKPLWQPVRKAERV